MVVATSRSEIEVARQDPIHQLALFLLSVHAQRIVPGNAKTKTSTAEVVKAKEARKASEFEILFPYVVYADFLVAELEAVVSPTKKVEAIDRVADPEHISRRNRRGHAY